MLNPKDQIASFFLFLLVVAGPFLKTFMLGKVSSSLQLEFIQLFFLVQFLVPLCNFGLAWGNTRKYLEKSEELPYLLSLTPIAILLLLFFVNSISFFVFFLTLLYSCMNYFLQLRRLAGDKYIFLFTRNAKVIFDISILFIVIQNKADVSLLDVVVVEFTVVLMIVIALCCFSSLRVKVIWNFFEGLNQDFLFVVGRVVDSSLMRLSMPFLFPNERFSQVFFILVGYEYVSQFANINFIKGILEREDVLKIYCLFVLFSMPLQMLSVYILESLYRWNLSTLEFLTVLIYGNLSILLILYVRVIKAGRANQYFRYIISSIITGLAGLVLAVMFEWQAAPLLLVLILPKALEALLMVHDIRKK